MNVTANITTLALPVSSPSSSSSRQSRRFPEYIGLQPIELINGCSEDGCSIESDDPHLTNVIRKHYLERFGHRDLEGIVKDYSNNAIMVNIINGERNSYHGHKEIKESFQEIFQSHPTVDSTFTLKHIIIHERYATAVWTAKTPTKIFPRSSETFLFDRNGKITKQFFTCQVKEIEHPWYMDE
jgi:hypothetical protein